MQGAHGSAQMQVRASPKEKKNEKKKEKNWFEAYDCQCSWAKTWAAAINRLQPLSKFDGLQLITDGEGNWIRMNQPLVRYMEVMIANICNSPMLEQW